MTTNNPLGTSLDGLVWPGDEAVARLLCSEHCQCRGHLVRGGCPINAARAIFKLIRETSAAPLSERAATAASGAEKLWKILSSIRWRDKFKL
jgi:hypothetical protein